MAQEQYRGYGLWGHAVPEAGRYVASGTVTRDDVLVQTSGRLDVFWTEDEARTAGIEWARAWVDGNS
jgi:hypothetical protein